MLLSISDIFILLITPSLIYFTADFKLPADIVVIPLTIFPSLILNSGKSTLSIPASFAEHTQGSTPLTPLMLPSRLSSPKISIFSRLTSSIYPFADKIANAIGKSNPVPHFLISAGDILTAILCGGNS